MRFWAGRVLTATAAAVAVALAPSTSIVGAAHADPAFELLMAQTDHGSSPMRWNPCQTEITFQVNTIHAREKNRSNAAARTRARTEIIAAMGQLADLTGMTFRYTGTTREIPTGDDWWERQGPQDEIVVAYVDDKSPGSRSSLLSRGASGEGGQVYTYEGRTVVVGRGFALFDSDKARSMRAGFGPGVRRGNLVLHELGHVVGLDHVSDKHQLMNPTISDRSPDGFAAGDRAGLTELGLSAGCIEGAEDFWSGS